MGRSSPYVDPNNIDFKDSCPPVGKVASLTHTAPMVELHGCLDEAGAPTPAIILVLDATRRFVATGLVSDGEFRLQFSDRHLRTSTWPLSAYAYEPAQNIATPVLFEADWSGLGANETEVPTYKDRYVEDIVAALKHPYTSISSKSDIRTGNGYQSIDLKNLETIGGRPARDLFFRHVNFNGKRVLDIGANTGELSRLARRRGAELVDGYEYDPFFVETGRMINAATGMTRVSLFQGDATDPRLYDGMRYDLVLAFAVWVYIEKVLARIANVTDAVFFETHTLDHGLEMYLKPMSVHFPFYRLLGHDENTDFRKSRAVLMFGKSPDTLDRTLSLVQVKTEPYYRNGFLDRHPKTDARGFLEYATQVAASVSEDTQVVGLGRAYFELFLAGYADYVRRERKLADDNIFLLRYRAAIAEGRIDKSLRYLLEDVETLAEKVTRKFRDVDDALADRWHAIPPIVVRPDHGPLTLTLSSGQKLTATNIDGHHRFFLAQLLSRPTIDALIREPLSSERRQVNTGYRL